MTGFGVNTQFNNTAWQGVPYQMPAFSNFNTNYNFFNNTNFNVPTFNYNNGSNYMSLFDAPASSSSKKKTLTYAERRKKIADNAEKIKQYNEALKENKAQIAEINAMKDEKGNVAAPKEGEKIETLADRKKMPWYKRTWKAVKAMGTGIFKMGADFAGFENGKFDLKKCLKNVGIAAAAIGLCALPGIGHAIAATMLWGGFGLGVFKIGKGVYDAAKAETAVERDRAFEDIGVGAFTVFTTGKAIHAKGAAFAGKHSAMASQANTKVGQIFKDTFVNSFKSTKYDIGKDIIAVRKAGGGFKGYGNVIADKTKASWAACKPKETFEASMKAQKQGLADKMAEIDAKLADPAISAQEKAMLQLEKTNYQSYAQQLNGLKTKSDWFEFGRNPISKQNQEALVKLQKEFATNGKVDINGQTITDKAFETKIAELIKGQNKLSSDAGNLLTAKDNAMARMGIRKNRFQSEVDEYLGGQSSNWFKTQWNINWMHNEGLKWYQIAWNGTKGVFKGLFQALGITYKPYQIYAETPCNAVPYKIEHMVKPYYQTFGQTVAAAEIITTLKQEQQMIKDELDKIYKN